MLTSMALAVVLAQSGAAPERAGELALAERVDAARAQRRVRELVALGPRMGGTRSGDAAAEYSAQALRELGLDVAFVDAPARPSYQPLSWSVRAAPEGDADAKRVLASAWPWQFSPDARGAARLALESSTGVAWLTERAGRGASAAAVVLAEKPTNADGSWPIPGRLREGAAQPCFGLGRADVELLREMSAGGAHVRIEFELDGETRTAPVRTVVARLPGAAGGEPWKSDYFLFCAHGDADSAGPGANDNASGVATVLEIATAWKRAIDAGAARAPAREVRFAIFGSEIYSTADYLKTQVPSQGRILGVINFDQAGFGSGADQVNVEPDDLEANVALVRALVGVMRDHAPGASGPPAAFPERWATNKSLGGTDSYVFSGSQTFKDGRLPSVSVFVSAWGAKGEHDRTPGMPGESWNERERVTVDYDLYYHSAGDLPEHTTDKEPWNMAWCARVGMLGGLRYLESLR
jgi:hypothetical protein